MAFFGFSQPQDPFAGLSGAPGQGDDDALEFEDTYAGQLDDADDALNDDTFGGGESTQQSVGKDFDFSGQTARMTGTLQEEQMLYTARQPPARANQIPRTEPARTGYERYKDPGYIPALEANASIWGTSVAAPKAAEPIRPSERASNIQASSRKMMSLEEVEAAMRAQSRGSPAVQPSQQEQVEPQYQQQTYYQPQQPGQQLKQPQCDYQGQPQILQRPAQVQAPQSQRGIGQIPPQADLQRYQQGPQAGATPPQILQRQQRSEPPEASGRVPQANAPRQQQQPRQILQNPQRLSGPGQPLMQAQQPSRTPDYLRGIPTGPSHGRGPSFNNNVITHPEQLMHLSEEERAAFLAEDAKRAKRNHKIHLLSKDNGLMTPQDKNFITRIQLQQLVTATGGVDEQGPEAALAEDFYYQVYSQIRGAPRQNPHQPANQFAQTYLFQTGGRYGTNGRRNARGGDNHMQRMEQQVQRAVEAAKAKPKNKQLVIEGSLGKISFSNSKTPKPLLNLKRPEALHGPGRKPARSEGAGKTDRRQALRNIEAIYLTLMRLEDHERNLPPPLNEGSDPDSIQSHMEWQQKLQTLLTTLWQQLKVMEPVDPEATTMHPFIAILSHAKGKKIIPRVFRHLDEQQRITIITMIVIQLDSLDVISSAIPTPEDPFNLPRAIKDDIDLFTQTIIPPILAHVNEFPLPIICGLFSLILDRTTVPLIVRTKVGLSLLTILISRAELLRQSTSPEAQQHADWEQWSAYYNRLFDALEPCLPSLFTTAVNDAEDVYVWQFLAAMGVGASPEQQQRLVIGVKDRVMETVKVSKALPAEMAGVRLGHVNLFMRAIGLDVELLG